MHLTNCLFQGPIPRGVPGERRPPFGRPEEGYGRGFEYEGPRFYPNGGPRNYQGEEQRGYHGDGHHSFPNDHRGRPPARRVSIKGQTCTVYCSCLTPIFIISNVLVC